MNTCESTPCCPPAAPPAHRLALQVNANDTVCTVPRLMGYAHVGHAIQLMGSGEAEVVMHTTEKLGEGVGLPDVAPAVTAMVAAKVSASQFRLLPCPLSQPALRGDGVAIKLCRAGPSPQLPPFLPAPLLRRSRGCCRMWRPKRSRKWESRFSPHPPQRRTRRKPWQR
jgi:hypothetical protein